MTCCKVARERREKVEDLAAGIDQRRNAEQNAPSRNTFRQSTEWLEIEVAPKTFEERSDS